MSPVSSLMIHVTLPASLFHTLLAFNSLSVNKPPVEVQSGMLRLRPKVDCTARVSCSFYGKSMHVQCIGV